MGGTPEDQTLKVWRQPSCTWLLQRFRRDLPNNFRGGRCTAVHGHMKDCLAAAANAECTKRSGHKGIHNNLPQPCVGDL
jgi:hypothetical protein